MSEIADGHSTLYIAQKYDLTTERLEVITASLFEKLGINDTDDLSKLAAT